MKRNKKLSNREMILFSLFAVLMFCARIIFAPLPNIHPVGMLIMVYTVVYRKKALIPIYMYVFLEGLFGGFSMWWIPYLYVWTVLWGMTMLVPTNIRNVTACIVYPITCALHGFLFGVLYAPVHAIMFGLNFEKTVAWIGAGLWFDIMHGISNFAIGVLVLPLSVLLKRLSKNQY